MGIQLCDLEENIEGKGKNCSSGAISPFPTMFSKAVHCSCVEMSMF